MTEPILIPLSKIQPNPYQPRQEEDLEAITEIAINIHRNGLMQVPSARAVNGHYELVFGHTRKAAFELLATKGVPAAEIKPDKRFASMPLNIRELTDRQMFEMAVAENLKRRELKPTERAKAIDVYMKQFKASSKEAGELFGMSDATVRGLVRLLELPEEAQSLLNDGKISQGVGRAILSAQRVASPEQIRKILARVEEEQKKVETQTGHWDQPDVPEVAIQEEIENLENVVELWWSSRGDKQPKSRSDNGWLLSMKDFPNKYLPLLTGHVAVQALDCFNDKPAQKLVLEFADYLAADLATFPDEKPDADYYEANEKQRQIRLDALKEINPDYAAKLLHLVDPVACTACPFYTTMRGVHYCGMKHCHTRKEAAWERELLHRSSKSLGIAVYDPAADGDFIVLQDTYQNKKHAELFSKKNKDLRLALMVDIDRKKQQNGYDKVPNGSVVIVVGKTLKGLQEEKKEAAEAAKAERDPEEVRQELFDEKRRLLDWEATLYFKVLFDNWSAGALDALEEASYGWSGNDEMIEENMPGEDAKPDELAEYDRRRYSYFLIGELDLYDGEDRLVKRAEKLSKPAKEWGIKLPTRFFKLAQDMDAEIQEAVSAATPEKKAKKK